MSWIIFFVYLIIFSWLITRIRFFTRSGLGKTLLMSLFLIKILAGIAYFQFYSTPVNKLTSDTWKFYNNSIAETDLLLTEPFEFIKGIFSTEGKRTGALFSDDNSYWNDLKDSVMVKLIAIINVFTGKNYYANIIFFNFLFLFGLIAFYRLIREIFGGYKWLLIISIFLIPSFLFWCSGIHKDGLIFSTIGMILYCAHRLFKQLSLRHVLVMAVSLILLFLLRNYLVFILLPALFVGWVVHLYRRQKLFIVSASLVLGTIFMFNIKYLHPSLNIPVYIVDKQSQFKKLTGGSAINTEQLEPQFSSFVSFLPTAVDVAFLRPHPDEGGVVSLLSSLEIIGFWLVCLVSLFFQKRLNSQSSIIISTWFFAICVLLVIGYTVHFSGAIVRYRSLIMPLIMAPLLANLAWNNSYNKK